MALFLTSLSSLAPAIAAVRHAPRISVRLAVSSRPGNIVYLQLDLAKALHYFKDEGLDVQFKFYEGGPNTAKALEDGQVEFSGNSIDHAVYTRNAPRPLKMLAAFTDLPAVTLTVRRSLRAQIRSIKDLRGRRIGIAALNSGTHVILASVLKSAGVPLDAVSIIPVGHTDQMIAAMKRGDIDAAVSTDPAAMRLLISGNASLLLDLVTYEETQRVFTGSYAFTGLMTRSDVIAHRQAVVQGMVNAVIRANQFIATHSAADIADALPMSAKHDRYVFVKSIEHTRPSFSKDGIVTAEGVANNIKSQKALGLVASDQTLDPSEFFDMRFAMHTNHR
ncbi:ABC transporter substrate-binding protein [Tunturiibacter gelidoferens]|uniref:ABC transporter substrate-binding protein n=1 Tax=Tunturiibacter gelidiferens TaxID=3069689 RepID=A0AAU7YZV9_9BACT